MPKKADESNIPQNISEQNNAAELMEIDQENENEQSSANKSVDFIPDITGIENEEIEDESGYKYNPEQFHECFILKNDLAKILIPITLKVLLSKKKYSDLKIKRHNVKEVYIVNRSWYEKWKKYSRYETIKRIIRTYENYKKRPIEYNPDEKSSPGIINNEVLLIRNQKSDESRNILVSKFNHCIDTKLVQKKHFKLLPKVRFDLLNNYFKSDIILKGERIKNNEANNYDIFCVHLRFVFLPTLASFKNVNEENIENFKKGQNIVYDLYFKQNASEKEVKKELNNIFKEKPQILSNMGIDLVMNNNEDAFSSYINNFTYYIPKDENNKSAKEIADFIFSNETIEKLKKDEKITQEEIMLTTSNYQLNLDNLFHLNWIHSKTNIDEVLKGIIFVEYLPFPDFESKSVASIFDIINKTIVSQTHISYHSEGMASRFDNGSPYDLDNFPIDKEKNRNGLVGLNNLGNSCYMNTGLQCLSNCELLTKYFLGDYYKEFINTENPIGSKGEIVEKYSQLIHHLWLGDNEYVSPIQFKRAFGKQYNAFNNYAQQDTQEFISYLLDVLHEDLNKVKSKPYIETNDLSENLSEEEQFKKQKDLYLCRNQSLIADLISGFFKSTLYCPDPNCKNIRKSFEPFNIISLSLVNEAKLRKLEEYQNEQNKLKGITIITISFIPFKINYKPLRFEVKIKKGMDISTFKKKIEIITGFNQNSFEIYKMQDKELICISPDIVLLEEFLKGDKKLFLFQIPPYVFGKPSDYFDKEYEELNNNFDKLYLEEEKYEGNDLYKKYNEKKQNKNQRQKNKKRKNKKYKNKTDDDLPNNKNINKIEEEKKEDEKEAEGNIENTEETEYEEKEEDDNDNNNINNNEEEENNNKSKEDEDIEMKDNNLFVDRNKWVKAELYNYTYKIQNNPDKPNEEQRVNNSRIIYINREWDNTQIYICILEMLEGVRNDLPEIKAVWFKDLYEVTKTIKEMESSKERKEILEYFEKELPYHPLMLEYLGFFNCKTQNIEEKTKKWNDSVVLFDNGEFYFQKAINRLEIKNKLSDVVLMFKILWKSTFASDYKEGSFPIEIIRSEKLEQIIKDQREEEFLKKNNIKIDKNSKSGKNKNNNLKLEELLTNFNEIEKLSNDNQWYCPKCKQFQLADKKMEIYSINEVIILHLKRFKNNQKNNCYVEFPLEGLNLGEYLPKKNEKNIFDLFAVANHVGGLNGGHYFAYCKNFKDGEWYEFNDSHVSKINKNEVVSSKAYVLFYSKRREEKINEEELYKKPFIKIDST